MRANATRRCTAALFGLFALFVINEAVAAGVGDACPEVLTRAIPPRPAGAPTGSDFARLTAAMSEAEREAAIGAELLAGNVPRFVRRLRPVTMHGRLPDGRRVRVTICVTPDYLALGSDHDFLRMPMGLETALAVADRFGFVLPTRRMVDAIHAQADVHMVPQPLPPTDEMRSNGYYLRHDRGVRRQRLRLGARLGALIAGQKKDLVITERLRRKPGRVAIYGWHRPDGEPIQPLSTVHGARYADYSHGVRLVSAVALVDGRPHAIRELLADPRLAGVLSDEGPIPRVIALVRDLAGRRNVAGLPARDGACRAVC